jgi:hypothetical protein
VLHAAVSTTYEFYIRPTPVILLVGVTCDRPAGRSGHPTDRSGHPTHRSGHPTGRFALTALEALLEGKATTIRYYRYRWLLAEKCSASSTF